jgi:hypothetical protein
MELSGTSVGRRASNICDERVSDAARRAYVLRIPGIVTKGLPELLDAPRQHALGNHHAGPQVSKEIVLVDQTSGSTNEVQERAEHLGLQRNRVARTLEPPLPREQLERAEFVALGLDRVNAPRSRSISAYRCAPDVETLDELPRRADG